MAKFCIFCGNKPQNKNMEHVIPQWLIKMTGGLSRPCHLPNIAPNGQSVAFGAFKFPACEKCNSEFSVMEARIKPIVIKVLESQPLNATEISLLLDWFDKVRVGVWLGDIYMSRTVDDIDPHMHIASRTGLKDRMLIVERVDSSVPGRDKCINFCGPGSFQFRHLPSVLQMHINNYTFTSVSDYCLVARRVGFPYCDKMLRYDMEDVRLNTIQKGKNKIQTPVVRTYTPTRYQTVIYQPIYKYWNVVSPDLYNTQYVLNHSLDTQNGIGGIFYQKNASPTKYLDTKSTLNLTPPISNLDMYDMGLKYFDLHDYITQNTYINCCPDTEIHESIDKMNKYILECNRKNREYWLATQRAYRANQR